jgi:hypothetical protein
MQVSPQLDAEADAQRFNAIEKANAEAVKQPLHALANAS